MKIKEPKYKILEAELKKNIISEKWKTGELIPTETELCKSTGTSRVTVRRALANLEAEGLINRSPGRGTVVTDFKDAEKRWFVRGMISQYIYTEGFQSELLSVESVIPSPADYVFRGFDDAERVTRFRILRKIDDTPFMHVTTYISSEYAKEVQRRFDNEHNAFIYQILEEITGKMIHKVEDVIDIAPVMGDVAVQLEIAEGTPVFLLTRILSDEDDHLVQLTRIYHRQDIQKLSMTYEKNVNRKCL